MQIHSDIIDETKLRTRESDVFSDKILCSVGHWCPLPLSSVRTAKNPRPRGYGVVVYFL